MDIETLRKFCRSLPHVTEDIKWGNDLCFLIGEKMFCVASLHVPFTFSFKVLPDEFEELTAKNGIVPAPYVARYHWVLVENVMALKKKEWEHYLVQSYNLVKTNLPKKVLKKLL